MAFQSKQPFFGFLVDCAASRALEEAAPAENYILDERVPQPRRDEFLAFNGFAAGPHDRDSWFQQHAAYARAHVALPAVSGTFTEINRDNFQNLSPDWDVVRIETLQGLSDRALRRGSHLSPSEAGVLIGEMLAARDAGVALDPFKQAELTKWLQLISRGSDRRPAFVAPLAEVEDILGQPDWENRLRDALGLGHIRPWAGNPSTVVLMQYNLIRVFNAHIGRPGWAASPTVLDDVPSQLPNPCFFPAPKSASKDGCGYTVDLSAIGATFRMEFLHAHIAYTLDDIRRIGEVTTDVLSSQIESARTDHRGLLANDLIHIADLPAKP